jgi:hypothetical protein
MRVTKTVLILVAVLLVGCRPSRQQHAAIADVRGDTIVAACTIWRMATSSDQSRAERGVGSLLIRNVLLPSREPLPFAFDLVALGQSIKGVHSDSSTRMVTDVSAGRYTLIAKSIGAFPDTVVVGIRAGFVDTLALGRRPNPTCLLTCPRQYPPVRCAERDVLTK